MGSLSFYRHVVTMSAKMPDQDVGFLAKFIDALNRAVGSQGRLCPSYCAIERRQVLTTVHVSFPVLRGTSRLFVQKGRRWSVIEHLLLDAVTREPGSAADFAAKSGLPRRVIVEAFIRLMRAGWVEINVVQSRLVFRATALGMVRHPWINCRQRQ